MEVIKLVYDKYVEIPRVFKLLAILLLFISLLFLPNRLFYRIFEMGLLIFLVGETKDVLRGSLIEYILLSTLEVGKNFSTQIVSYLISYRNFQYYRSYDAAFVFLDSDILLIFILAWLLYQFIFAKKQKAQFHAFSFDIWILIFYTIISISTLASVNFYNSVLGFVQITRGLIIYFVFRTLSLDYIVKKSGIIFSIILLSQSLLGIVQYIRKVPVGFIFEIGKYLNPQGINQQEGLYSFMRATGTFTEPNLYGLILNMLIPFALINYFFAKNLSTKTYYGLTFLSATAAVLVSFSRMSWFLYCFNLWMIYRLYKTQFKDTLRQTKAFVMSTKRYQIYVGGFVAFVLYFVISQVLPRSANITTSVFEKWGSFNARLYLIKESLTMISSYPFLGVGLFNFVPVMVKMTSVPANEIYISSVHNIYFLIASEVGLPALIVFLLLFRLAGFIYLNKRRVLTPKKRPIYDCLALSLLSFMFAGLFLSYFYAGIQFVFLMLLLGIFINISRENSAIISYAPKNSLRHHSPSLSS